MESSVESEERRDVRREVRKEEKKRREMRMGVRDVTKCEPFNVTSLSVPVSVPFQPLSLFSSFHSRMEYDS